jgi:hypothetical protein
LPRWGNVACQQLHLLICNQNRKKHDPFLRNENIGKQSVYQGIAPLGQCQNLSDEGVRQILTLAFYG